MLELSGKEETSGLPCLYYYLKTCSARLQKQTDVDLIKDGDLNCICGSRLSVALE